MASAEANVKIRFLTLKGQQSTLSFPSTSNFDNIRHYLQNNWPEEFGALEPGSELKFIYSGKFLKDEDTLEGLKFTPNSVQTVHVSVKPPTAPVTSIPGDGELVAQDDAHLHGFVFDEHEAEEITRIFEKKKGPNETITFAQLVQFLHSYWQFMQRTNNIPPNTPFPEDRLDRFWSQVCGQDRSVVNLEQFRTMFFLFCNTTAADTPCPHGQKDRLREATAQLHTQVSSPISFQNDTFEQLFATIDTDHDGVLSCVESELLFYLYSAEVMKKVPVVENVPPPNAAGAALS